MKCRALLLLLSMTTWGLAAAQEATVPRTPWGAPDLSGVWDYRTATPLQAPKEKEDGEEEDEEGGSVFGEPWEDSGTELTEPGRASLIVDPPDGRFPPRTEYGEENGWEFWEKMASSPAGPEDRSIFERCITSALVPLESVEFNNNMQILQTPDFVVLLLEMIHEARIIPLRKTEPAPAGLRFWLGESRGRYEGDTLVVETTNFKRYGHPLGTTPDMKIVERFTRRGDQLIYEWTVTDPKVYESPFTARQTLKKSPHQIYEYACHEGNRSMPLMLSGARAEDERAKETEAIDEPPKR